MKNIICLWRGHHIVYIEHDDEDYSYPEGTLKDYELVSITPVCRRCLRDALNYKLLKGESKAARAS